MEPALKPYLEKCPFCSGPADFRDDGQHGYAYCTHCLARTDDFYSWRDKNWKEDAARDWNARVFPPEIQATIDRDKPKQILWDTFFSKGEEFERSRCPRCRNGLDKCREKFCPNCGQRLDWGEE